MSINIEPETNQVAPPLTVDDGRRLLTNSRMACLRTCPRKHYFVYELGLRRRRQSGALRLGGAFHLGLELRGKGAEPAEAIAGALAGYQEIPHWADPREWAVERETVAALLAGHFAYWAADAWEVVATERTFELPIVNPETDTPGRNFRLAGKMDKIVKMPDGRLALVEYKTASNPDADYWDKLKIDFQISLEMYAARELGFEVATVIYDVTRKPSLRPYRATPAETRKYKKDGTLYASMRDQDETPQEYGARITQDIAERPDWYYRRQEIPRLEQDLLEFQYELWQTAGMLRDCQRHGRWPRHTNSCLSPFRCDYAEVCFQGMNPVEALPEGFEIVPYVHVELMEE